MTPRARRPFHVSPTAPAGRPIRPLLIAMLTLATLMPASPARAGSALGGSSDSVTRVRWVLSNGMHVLAQHIPDGRGIAITVGYPGGIDQDPPSRPGLASVLAELQFTAAAGDVPERSRSEMPSLRPSGYEVRLGRSLTLFTELATRTQVAGVIHQVATRMRGVQITPQLLAAALESVRARHRLQYLGSAGVALYNEVPERASGVDDAGLARLTSLSGLEKLGAREAQELVTRAFPSRRAVVSIAGNLEGLDLRPLVERELGPLAGGAPQAPPPIRPGRPTLIAVPRAGIDRPTGVLGVMAPALTDSTHPAFYLAALIMGAQADVRWGDPQPPLMSRFQYGILEDPDLVRFYPPLARTDHDPRALSQSFRQTIGDMDNLVVGDDVVESLRAGVDWLLGGSLHAAVLAHMRTESGSLTLLTNSMIEREMNGGDAFWNRYRRRLKEAGVPDLVYWLAWLNDPNEQVALLYLPR
ncbi:MAG: hypothetical protein HYR73_02905 [Candidatus Eisenbacteria bacterium]|nr:hypothetical protein [Candidatus Eisenbacteria bacterium]